MTGSPMGRAYRIKLRWQLFALLWTAFGGVFWGNILWRQIQGTEDLRLWPFVASALWVGGGSAWVVHMFQATVTLFHDAIETRGLLGRERLRFSDIRGRRTYAVKGDEGSDTWYYKIEARDGCGPTLDFMKDYDFDYEFHEWFQKLPDLDALDPQKGA